MWQPYLILPYSPYFIKKCPKNPPIKANAAIKIKSYMLMCFSYWLCLILGITKLILDTPKVCRPLYCTHQRMQPCLMP